MSGNVRHRRDRRNSEAQLPLEAAWLEDAAQALGTTPHTVEQWIYGREQHAERLATILRKAIAHGNTRVATHILAPILAAAAQIQSTPITSENYVRVQEAFADLARDEINYRQAPTRERALAFRRGLERCVTTLLALRQGLEVRHELGHAG